MRFSPLLVMLAEWSTTTNASESPPNASSSPMTAGKHRQKGEEYFIAREYNRALSHYNSAIKLEPTNHVNHFKKYNVHRRMKKYEEARENLLQTLVLKPDYPAAVKALAETSYHLGYCAESAEQWQNLFNIAKEDELKNIDEQRKKSFECAQLLHHADQIKQQDNSTDNTKRERDHLVAALDMIDYPRWALLERKATLNFLLGDFYEVVADMGMIIKKDGKNIQAYAIRGDAYYKLGGNKMPTILFTQPTIATNKKFSSPTPNSP